ncbi:MAG: NAD(P)H-binding protein [Luminiphilus sp.]
MKLLLAGGTGLIGQAFLARAQSTKLHVTAVGRRPTGLATEDIVADFADLPAMPSVRVAVCTLGTTIRAAGSQDAFRAIDFDAVIAFATAAKTAGAEHFLTVTAVGANAKSSVFYSRVKGEVERELSSMHFQRLDIVQPGLLLGNRAESRPVETLLKWMASGTDVLMQGPWRRYRSIAAHTVAESLLVQTTHSAPGLYIHQHQDILKLVAGAP